MLVPDAVQLEQPIQLLFASSAGPDALRTLADAALAILPIAATPAADPRNCLRDNLFIDGLQISSHSALSSRASDPGAPLRISSKRWVVRALVFLLAITYERPQQLMLCTYRLQIFNTH